MIEIVAGKSYILKERNPHIITELGFIVGRPSKCLFVGKHKDLQDFIGVRFEHQTNTNGDKTFGEDQDFWWFQKSDLEEYLIEYKNFKQEELDV